MRQEVPDKYKMQFFNQQTPLLNMRKTGFFNAVICMLCTLAFAACSDDETKSIGLSVNEIRIEKIGGIQEVQTDRNSWWLSDVILNGEYVTYAPNVEIVEESNHKIPVEIKSDSFSFRKTDAGIRIELDAIGNEEQRTFIVVLQDGDAFEYLTIYQ